LLARGVYSPGSQILARLWTFDGRPVDGGLFLERFQAAQRLREAVVSPDTTGYRAVNSEGDLCPGVLLDVYGEAAVLELLTEGTEKRRAELEQAAREILGGRRLVVRESGESRDRRGGAPSARLAPRGGEGERLAPFREGGLRFFADVSSGQKTGFYLDQRENRTAVAAYAHGDVLDAFCYTGGFALHAARAGATVTGIDISAEAVQLAAEHARLNGVEGRCTFQAANAFDALRAMARAGPQFDMVILDPPAFAPSRADVAKAAAGYKEINLRALKLVRPGGILVSCSCSFHISEGMLLAIVAEAAHDARRRVRLLEARSQGRDHPVHPAVPQTRYLKCLVLEVR
jgi:23S rRNA (cytosine1962-C5)-methyltransferase